MCLEKAFADPNSTLNAEVYSRKTGPIQAPFDLGDKAAEVVAKRYDGLSI
jgi:hypothetical protein